MKVFKAVSFNLLLWISLSLASNESRRPNIIVITADDMGWNDVSFHGSNLYMTPNIDALAYNGIILNDFHTSALCTPSRSALMTGKYPLTTGMQRSVILEAEPRGLPLNLSILPQYFKDYGYKTHLVGKWHLGFYKEEYTPTKRGFDTFYGFWQGHQDYFNHTVQETFGDMIGYDMRHNLEVDWSTVGEYGTDLYSRKAVEVIERHDQRSPLFLYLSQIAPHAGTASNSFQVPTEEEEKFSYIPDAKRRKYAAKVSKLDQSIGQVVKALSVNGMLDNSIILFVSDNGAPTVGTYATTGSNYPFRGIKGTEWEGGTRVPAVLWSPLLSNQQRVSNMMMHMVDVLPTLLSAAADIGSRIKYSNLDGIDMWETLLRGNDRSPRTEHAYNIDPATTTNAAGAVRLHNWKYFQGNRDSTGDGYTWYNDLSLEAFHVTYDPTRILESEVNTAIALLYAKLSKFRKLAVQHNENEVDKEDEIPATTQLTSVKIHHLRKDATIRCNVEKSKPPCRPELSPCLINLQTDACERYNLAEEYPQQFNTMKKIFERYRSMAVAPLNKPADSRANPACWGGVWTPWESRASLVCRKPLFERVFRRVYNLVGSAVSRFRH